MEETITPHLDNSEEKTGCIQCSNPDVIEGYPNALCKSCRDGFTKLSVPLWVKLFGAFVLLVLVVSLFEIPKNFSTAISLQRAEKAETEGNYLTEQHELEKIRNNAPDAFEVAGHLIIASFYNNDFNTFGNIANELSKKTFDDTSLVNKINVVMEKSKDYFPTDSFRVVTDLYPKGLNTIPAPVLKKFVSKFTGDTYAIFTYAASFFNQDSYSKCDSLLNPVLGNDPDYMPALYLKSIVKRELNQQDSSLIYCDKMLLINHQYSLALASKARTTLKQGKKSEGLKMALSTYLLDKNEPYVRATLALAYHVTGNTSGRDNLIAIANKDSLSASYMQYVKDVMNGKYKF